MPALRFNSLEHLQEVLGIPDDPNAPKSEDVTSAMQEAAPAPSSSPVVAAPPDPSPTLVQLAQVVKKALEYGDGVAVIVRNGYCSLVFVTGNQREVVVELLPHETLFTVYYQYRVLARKDGLPALSAHELLRALPFESISLRKSK